MYQPKLSVHIAYIMTTYYNCFHTLSSCFFYTATCPFLRLDRTEVVYNKKYFTFEFGGVNTLYLVLVPQKFDYRYEVNTLVSFICYQGYYREGSGSAICQSSGNWSEQTPKCVAASKENEPLYSMSVTF